jgi:hypothetical protein
VCLGWEPTEIVQEHSGDGIEIFVGGMVRHGELGTIGAGTRAAGRGEGVAHSWEIEALLRGLFHVQPLDRGRWRAMGVGHYPQPVRNAC